MAINIGLIILPRFISKKELNAAISEYLNDDNVKIQDIKKVGFIDKLRQTSIMETLSIISPLNFYYLIGHPTFNYRIVETISKRNIRNVSYLRLKTRYFKIVDIELIDTYEI